MVFAGNFWWDFFPFYVSCLMSVDVLKHTSLPYSPLWVSMSAYRFFNKDYKQQISCHVHSRAPIRGEIDSRQ